MRLVNADAIEMELGVEDRDLYVQHILDSAPTVEAEPIKHGRWIRVHSDDSLWKCSVCGEKSCCKSAYCGDCGAKMDAERSEDGNTD